MPPKRTRDQHARLVNNVAVVGLAPEVIVKRTKRHLEELERSNYSEPTLLAGEDDEEGGKSAKGRARQTISDKRNLNIAGTSAAAKKKKSTMNVRTALLYRKNLATLIDESLHLHTHRGVCVRFVGTGVCINAVNVLCLTATEIVKVYMPKLVAKEGLYEAKQECTYFKVDRQSSVDNTEDY
ncbi:hypothetical protein C0995_008183 [Termitomyces sp. Mi166|nr:hypothetical protein C0995_008183 [Termitomyces sp. Mi166\